MIVDGSYFGNQTLALVSNVEFYMRPTQGNWDDNENKIDCEKKIIDWRNLNWVLYMSESTSEAAP